MSTIDQLRITRRNRKGNLTRVLKELFHLIERNGSPEEISTVKAKARKRFELIEECHDNLVEQIESDEGYEKEQEWMGRCQDEFMAEIARLDEVIKTKRTESTRDVPEVEVNQSIGNDVTNNDVTNAVNDDVSEVNNSVNGLSNVSNVSNVDNGLVGLFKALTLPQTQIRQYEGDPLYYHAFITSFHNTVTSIHDDNVKLNTLMSLCAGKALQSIQYCVLKPPGEGYQSACKTLKERFGNTAVIVQAWIGKVLGRPKLESAKLGDFVDDLENCYEALSALGYLGELNNQSSLRQIIEKLPRFLQNRWQSENYRLKEKGVVPKLENVVKFVKASAQEVNDPVFGNIHGYAAETQPKKKNQVHNVTVNSPATTTIAPREKFPRCWVCKTDSHWPDRCEKFIGMKVEDRFELVKGNHACFSCLKIAGRNHRMSNCSRKRVCGERIGDANCDRFHHKLLHLTKNVGVGNLGVKSQDEPLLCVLEVEVMAKIGKRVANVMLDLGSQGTFVRKEFADQLGVKGRSVAASITKVGGAEENFQSRLCELKLLGSDPEVLHNIKALEMPTINEVNGVDVSELERIFHMRNTLKRRGGQVDILIGVDYAHLMTGETKKSNGLIALKSPLGWAVFGGRANDEIANRVMHIKINKPVNLEDFWSVEAMGVDIGGCDCKAKMSVVEDMEAKLIENSSSKVGNQWIISYPWVKDPALLPNNRWQAEKMLNGLEKRLNKNNENGSAYQKQMEEMVERGFARKLSEKELQEYQGPVHYLPHHAVVRAENKSTPIRIVFNSANKCNGLSINDYWMKGPDLLNNLNGVLLRFREKEVAICGDISKMYHRILIPKIDQHVHRYLWRDLRCNKRPDTYVMQVLTFGDKPAAAMAQTALKLTAKEGEEKFPNAAHVLLNDTYMDDVCTSVSTVGEAKTLTNDLDTVLSKGGFQIKEWLSNKPLENEARDGNSKTEQKVLGVTWNYEKDTLGINVKLDDAILNGKITKRKALGVIAQLFDPIGFLAPVIVKLKMKMQEMWESGISWDESLPERSQQEWKLLLKEIRQTNAITLPRCLTPTNSTNNVRLTIFCDASEKAYGACAYLQWELTDGTFDTRFITGKSRVAPLKKLTIPRLELQSAVMAARIGSVLAEEFSLSLHGTLYFTDSMIVLGWLKKSPSCYKQFVGARVLEIQNKTKVEQWMHVAGVDNPADDISRGIPVEHLNRRWLVGPQFLKRPMSEYKQEKLQVEGDDKEIKLVKFTGTVEVKHVQPEVNIEDCYTWEDMLDVYRERIYGQGAHALDVYQVRDIELLLLRRVQRECFAEELQLLKSNKEVQKGSRLTNLDPKFDTEHELIRVGGRLRNLKDVEIDTNPIVLDPKHRVTKLLIRREDANVFKHSAGPNQVFAQLRRNYWILKGRSQVKSVLNHCTECQRWRKGTEVPKMAALPDARLRIRQPPFYSTGMDCWGPMLVKVRRSQEKRWGIIFKCMTTRAVHLEVLRNMNADAFIMAFRRFVARKGVPKEVYSDCGTNFKGAERELSECFKAMSPALQEKLAQQQVEFNFNPPNAPHFGGIWEREVKSIKNAIRCCLKDRVITEVVLQTVIAEVEGLMNSKPLGYASSDITDTNPVTPNMLLMGRRAPLLPFTSIDQKERVRSNKQWRHAQLIIDLFWNKFVSEYLPSLQIRQKWVKEVHNLKEGDKVLVVDNQAQRGDWPVGVVVKVHPSADDRVRVADIKIKDKVYKRPVVKLIKLEQWM